MFRIAGAFTLSVALTLCIGGSAFVGEVYERQ